MAGFIEANQLDLAPVDASRVVDRLEESLVRNATSRKRGCWAGVGHGLADFDFRVGDARTISLIFSVNQVGDKQPND